MRSAPVSLSDILGAKGKRKLVMLTAYDYTSARLVDAGGADMVLVGDSLGMTMMGRPDTVAVTLKEMIHHGKAVRAGVERAFIVCDMPFMSYETGCRDALKNAARLFRKTGIRAVKIEGGFSVLPQVRALADAGIPVMGHIGLTPQRAACLGGFKVQGKTAAAAIHLFKAAQALEKAGCFALLLEAIPAHVAQEITEHLQIPTIGIGAGAGCDGQVLVFHDLLGLYENFTPRFVKRYAVLGETIKKAVGDYGQDVRAGLFPGREHSFPFSPAEQKSFQHYLHQKAQGKTPDMRAKDEDTD